MADTLTQFSDVTAATYTQLQAGVTIASTAAGQQAVIKDVVLNDTAEREYELRSGAHVLGAFKGSAHFTGSEIMGANSTLKVHATQVPLLNAVQGFSDAATYRLNTFTAPNSLLMTGVARPTSITAVSTATAITTALTESSAVFHCFGANGDFYYTTTEGSQSHMYRRAGGVNGVETSLTGSRNVWVADFDGRYIYMLISITQLQVYDTQLNTLGAVITMTGFAPSWNIGYARICGANGFMWVNCGADTHNPFLVNCTTGLCTELVGTAASQATFRQYCCLAQNTAGEWVVLRTRGSSPGSLMFDVLSALGDGATVVRSGSVGSATYALPHYGGNHPNALFRVIGVTNYAAYITSMSNSLRLFDLTTMREFLALTVQGNNWGNVGRMARPILNPTLLDAQFGTLAARATGVLVTE